MDDPYDLARFVTAQDGLDPHHRGVTWESITEELRAGRKSGHWMWFVFPQIAGLGHSDMARHYAIEGLAEAQDYLAHHLLGARLLECTGAMLDWAGKRSAERILGSVDALKFASSMTLFEAAGGGAAFGRALDAFYRGDRDARTLDLLAKP